jgi:nitroreductase
MTIQRLSELIRLRRSVYPKNYDTRPVSRETIDILLENARWAPTHKRTEPWRFIVFHSVESRAELGDYLYGYYQKNTPAASFSEEKMVKMRDNPQRAAAVIALVMQRSPDDLLPEFEEVAAMAMAVQNMWLSATALGLGSYWSSPSAMLNAADFLGLAPGQRCLGMFYLGWYDTPLPEGKRHNLDEKVQWR